MQAKPRRSGPCAQTKHGDAGGASVGFVDAREVSWRDWSWKSCEVDVQPRGQQRHAGHRIIGHGTSHLRLAMEAEARAERAGGGPTSCCSPSCCSAWRLSQTTTTTSLSPALRTKYLDKRVPCTRRVGAIHLRRPANTGPAEGSRQLGSRPPLLLTSREHVKASVGLVQRSGRLAQFSPVCAPSPGHAPSGRLQHCHNKCGDGNPHQQSLPSH